MYTHVHSTCTRINTVIMLSRDVTVYFLKTDVHVAYVLVRFCTFLFLKRFWTESFIRSTVYVKLQIYSLRFCPNIPFDQQSIYQTQICFYA